MWNIEREEKQLIEYLRGKQTDEENPASNGEGAAELRLALDDGLVIVQPVAGGEDNVEAANPPADLEGGGAAIGAEGEEAEEEAKGEPAEEHDERGLQKYGLRL